MNTVADLLNAFSYGASKTLLLGKHIPNAGNIRIIAVVTTIEENDHC
jgi:hypothetical protein